MTTRELTITKAILDYLHSLDAGQATEIQIHEGVCKAWPPGPPKPSAGEVEAAITNCDAEKWIAGVPARFTRKMKWNITDDGEGARMGMR